MTAPTDPVTRARQLIAAATPGPWGPTVYRGTGLGWDVDGPESGIRGQFDVEADAELIAAAPGIIADLLADHDRLADENRALREQLEEAQLRSIEARNPGIDMDEVRASRAAAADRGVTDGDRNEGDEE